MLRKLVSGVVVLLVLGYLGICGFMYANQRDMMYFPQHTRVDAADTDFTFVHDGVTLRGWQVNPGKRDAILYFGGNAERIEANRADFTKWFPDSSVYLVPYRGYGANDGKPEEQSLFADALALFDRIQTLHPGASIGVIGRSLGSGVASYVAAQRPVARLALVTPFDSMAETGQAHYPLLPVRWLTRDRYDSVSNLSRYDQPVLVVRAGKDEIIPAANTARLISSLHKPPQVVELTEAGHNSIDDDPAYGEALSTFFR